MIVLNSIIENCVTCVGAATESLYLIYRRLKLTVVEVAAHRNPRSTRLIERYDGYIYFY